MAETQEKIVLELPDGKKQEFRKGASLKDAAGFLGEKFKKAVAGKVNGIEVDLLTSIEGDAKVLLYLPESREGRQVLRHSASHILAAAVKELWPETKLGIGPAIDEGFYYDFLHEPFKPEDLKKIKEQIAEIISRKERFERIELSRTEAEKKLIELKEDFKLELLRDLPEGEKISFYKTGSFIDLCKGPHVLSSSSIKAFDLTETSSAYWKGSEKNPVMQRIYGTAFESKEALNKHLALLEEAKKRDHRKIGRELDLFSFNQLVGSGLPLWHPNGALIKHLIQDFLVEELLKRGYSIVSTPHLTKLDLLKKSGHYDYYKELMFWFKQDEEELGLKPMNCPMHMLIYQRKTHSFKELPVRLAEVAVVYRKELSGVVQGLTRVRHITQDDAHIFCTQEQVKSEIGQLIGFSDYLFSVFGFKEKRVVVSTRPEKFLGDKAVWDKAESALLETLKEAGLNYEIDEGAGAFYGPKIDIMVKDAIEREWQLSTIQLDFNLPEKFGLEYAGTDNRQHRPVMIHRALLGSLERFIGVWLEHIAGKLPLWLAPVQVKLLTVTERNDEFALKVLKEMQAKGLRVELDARNESISKKVRDAQLEKINYMITIGDKEAENNTLAVRTRDGKVSFGVKAAEFIEGLLKEIESKEIR
ncbi:threonine--tRNA ligase [archaeon]|nr:threonine--tRNA ligase [archaeon]